MDKIILTQTILKKLKDDRYCPQRIKRVYIDRTLKEVPTEAMTKGMFFEYITLGNPNKDGNVINDLPRKRGGEKTIDQIRIEQQAKRFKDEVLPLYDIQIVGKGETFSIEHEGVTLTITVDLYGAIRYNELLYPLIGDLKLTKDMNESFGDFSWGFPQNMDHTQAILYTWVFTKAMEESKENFDRDPLFIYFVFDYKPVPEYKLVHVAPERLRYAELKQLISDVTAKIIYYEQTSWPYKPNYVECAKCPFLKECPSATRKPNIEIV